MLPEFETCEVCGEYTTCYDHLCAHCTDSLQTGKRLFDLMAPGPCDNTSMIAELMQIREETRRSV